MSVELWLVHVVEPSASFTLLSFWRKSFSTLSSASFKMSSVPKACTSSSVRKNFASV